MSAPKEDTPVDLYRLFELPAASSFTEGTDFLPFLMSSANPYNRKFRRGSLAVLQAALAAIVPGATALSPHSNQWVSTAAATLANSTTETTLIGAGKGTLTTPLAALAVGSTFVIEAHGVIGTHSSAGVPTLALKLGSKTLASLAPTLGNSLTAVPWMLRATVVVTTAGGSGAVNVGGELIIHDTTTTKVSTGFSAAVGSTDLSAAAAWNLTADWDAANAANTVTLRTLTIDRIR